MVERTENIQILRDTWGVPHIYAETELGAIYGQGLHGFGGWEQPSRATGERTPLLHREDDAGGRVACIVD